MIEEELPNDETDEWEEEDTAGDSFMSGALFGRWISAAISPIPQNNPKGEAR